MSIKAGRPRRRNACACGTNVEEGAWHCGLFNAGTLRQPLPSLIISGGLQSRIQRVSAVSGNPMWSGYLGCGASQCFCFWTRVVPVCVGSSGGTSAGFDEPRGRPGHLEAKEAPHGEVADNMHTEGVRHGVCDQYPVHDAH
eukprot:CAMPEP_0196658418 /NCGR_PEP_ID=MMETSP1086-20130531/29571_1 /TAXON_ID=77921 /ORGANISM="Cyanoptyche  gloeocystis , Strain SAG4.97" /LENGTH=140 /DNA_ID=CAMNT_0041991981 /DNA_START=230 /DNA_END=652 /DNA_ORIENTATION=+